MPRYRGTLACPEKRVRVVLFKLPLPRCMYSIWERRRSSSYGSQKRVPIVRLPLVHVATLSSGPVTYIKADCR